jgi:hypothetical protein
MKNSSLKLSNLLLLGIAALSIDSFAQENAFNNAYLPNNSNIRGRWNFKLGYTLYDTNGHRFSQALGKRDITIGNYRIEGNYGVSNLIESGVYWGYSKIDALRNNGDSSATFKGTNTLFYGITVNFHIVPLFTKAEYPVFDLYLTGKIGGVNFLSQKGFYPHGQDFEYGIGSGLSFYILKNFGIYAEGCYGNYFYDSFLYVRTGIVLRF